MSAFGLAAVSAAAHSDSQGCFSLGGGGGAGSEGDSRSGLLGVSASDLQCPICVDTIRDAFVTACGHTFCHACLQTHLRNKRSCPSCSAYLTSEQCYPNFLLNKVLHKAASARTRPAATLPDCVQQLLGGKGDSALVLSRLKLQDLDAAIELLKERRQQLTHQQHTSKLLLLLAFLNHAKQTKEHQLIELQAQLQVLEQDMHKLQHQRRRQHRQQQQQQQDASSARSGGGGGGGNAWAAPLRTAPLRSSSVIILNKHAAGASATAAAVAAAAAARPEAQVHVHHITHDAVNTITIQKDQLPPGAVADLAQPLLGAWQQHQHHQQQQYGQPCQQQAQQLPAGDSGGGQGAHRLRQHQHQHQHQHQRSISPALPYAAHAESLNPGAAGAACAVLPGACGGNSELSGSRLQQAAAAAAHPPVCSGCAECRDPVCRARAAAATAAATGHGNGDSWQPGAAMPVGHRACQHGEGDGADKGQEPCSCDRGAVHGLPARLGEAAGGMRETAAAAVAVAQAYGGTAKLPGAATTAAAGVQQDINANGYGPPSALCTCSCRSARPPARLAPAPAMRAAAAPATGVVAAGAPGAAAAVGMATGAAVAGGMAVGSGAIARGSASSLPRVPSNGRLGDGGAVSLNGHVGPSSSQAIVQVHGHGHGLGQAHGGTLIKAQQQQQHGQGYSQAHGGALVQAQLQLYGHGQTPALGVALVQAQAQQQSHAHAAQKRKMLSQFDELEGAYFQLRRKRLSTAADALMPPSGNDAGTAAAAATNGTGIASTGHAAALTPSSSLAAAAAAGGSLEVSLCNPADTVDQALDLFNEVLSTATHSNRLSVLAEMYRPTSSVAGPAAGAQAQGAVAAPSAGSNIISSIEFNLDESMFAAAGVSARISIYNYASILSSAAARPPTLDPEMDEDDLPVGRARGRGSGSGPGSGSGGGSPVLAGPSTEICTRSKLTCLSYSKATTQHLIAGDYNGVVTLWDTETKQSVMDVDGHDRRIWSVDFNSCPAGDPTIFLSGSDDCTVKVWSTRHEATVAVLGVRANVCSVRFNPWHPHQLAVGSAAHLMHLYDLRYASQPLSTFAGHSKAVSYVRFLNRNEVVTASTDNTLRLWDCSTASATVSALDDDAVVSGGGPVAAPQQLQGSCLRTFSGHQNERNFVGLSVDAGQFIACGSESNQVYLYYKAIATPSTSFSLAPSDSMQPGVNGAGHAGGARGAAAASASRGFISALCWRQQSHTLVAANSQGRMVLLGMDS